jgi:hypothetical protein
MKRAAALVALLTVLVGPAGAEGRGSGGTIGAFVATVRDGVVVLGGDLSTRVGAIRVQGARAVAATIDARRVVVTTPRGLTLIDGRRRRVLATIGGFRDARSVCLDFGGRHAYVADVARRQLVAVDLARRRIAWRVRLGARPGSVALFDATVAAVAGGRLALVEEPRELRWIGARGSVRVAALAPDGVSALLAGHGRTVSRVGLVDGRAAGRMRLRAPASALTADATGHAVWAAEGRRAEVLSPAGLRVGGVVESAPIRELVPVGGWVALVTRDGIDLVASPSLVPRERFPVAGSVRSVAFVVT